MGLAVLDRPLPTRRQPRHRASHVVLVPSTSEHVGPVADRMRAADRIEAAALGHSPRDALLLGLRASTKCLTVKINGRAEAMCGVTPGASLADRRPVGVPWLLGTDAIARHPRVFLTEGRRLICSMLDRYGRLENGVSASNAPAISMLRRLGFTIADVPIMIGGLPFLHFALERGGAHV